MKGKFTNIKIAGLASAVPEYVIDNMNYSEIFGSRRTKKQAKLTGIIRHHIAMNYQRTSDLCMHAAKKLISHLDWDISEIKILIFGTQHGDYIIPSTAIDLSERLGLSKDCMAYDINLGCSSFDLCVQTAAHLLQSQKEHTKAIVLVGDPAFLPNPTKINDNSIANSMMFGAGGGVAAIEKENGNTFLFNNHINGVEWDAIVRYFHTNTLMDGNKVFDFATNDVSSLLKEFFKENELDSSDIDCYSFHQAQKAIIDIISHNCNLEPDKVIKSYEEYGNTSGASVPITICHNKHIFNSKEECSILSCGFGVGLSVGISYYTINPQNILPVFETSEHFDDHRLHSEKMYNRYAILMHPENELDMHIGRELDRESCNLAIFSNNSTIETLRNQFFWKDIESFNSLEESLNLKQKYHSLVYDFHSTTNEELLYEVEFLYKNNILFNNAVIVIIDKKANEGKVAEFIKDFVKIYDSKLRINAVLYEEASIDLYPAIGDSPSWFERWIETGGSNDMKRTFFISNAVKQFIITDFAAISESIVKIDGKSNMAI